MYALDFAVRTFSVDDSEAISLWIPGSFCLAFICTVSRSIVIYQLRRCLVRIASVDCHPIMSCAQWAVG